MVKADKLPQEAILTYANKQRLPTKINPWTPNY